jgi:hypothetical protein
MSELGFVSWPSGVAHPTWTFDWQLMDGPDDEGIAILDASYQGRLVFAKASLAGFRTHYPPLNRFGQPQQEYKIRDDLPYNNARPHDELMFQAGAGNKLCPTDKRVCVASVTSGVRNGILLQAYYCKGIGCYRLTQQWVFWDDGTISPRIYSMGIQHNEDHSHHAYWRFDFSIDAPQDNQLLALQATNGQAQWVPFSQEGVAVKASVVGSPSWAVRNKISNRGYYIYPGPHDGTADSFAQHDLWVMRFHADEDMHGDNFTKDDDHLMVWINNNEDVDGQHLVVYYCSHLFHELPGPADEWHGAGPDLVPFSWNDASLSLKYHVPGSSECHVLGVGDSLEVQATVSGLSPVPQTVQYHWSVVGATASGPTDVTTNPNTLAPDDLSITDVIKLKLVGLSSDVTVTCNVKAGSQQLSQEIKLSPLSADLASREEAICELVSKLQHQRVGGIINPLGPDDPFDLRSLVTAPGGILELNRIANRLASATDSPSILAQINRVAKDLRKVTGSLLE